MNLTTIRRSDNIFTTYGFGGRLTKFKGVVASIAPMMGAAVVFSGISTGVAMADNECGSENLANPADTITCGAGNYAGGATYPEFPSGITYSGSDGLELTLDDPAMTVDGSGVRVSSSAGTGGDISVIGSDFDTITTVGTNSVGNSAIDVGLTTGYTGGASIILGEQAGTIATTGRSSGAFIGSSTSGPGDLLIEMHGGDITTDGFQANAVQIYQSPTNGPTPIPANSPGAAESTGNLTVRMTGGTILAQGDSSDGITLNSRGLGNALVEMTGGSIEANVTDSLNVANPSNSGRFANGISIYLDNPASSSTATVRMTSGRIDVDGPFSNGVILENNGAGLSSVTASGDAVIEAVGAGSSGINLGLLSLDGSYEIILSDWASVTGGHGSGAGITVRSLSSGTISIGENATLSAYSDAAINTQLDVPQGFTIREVEVTNDGTIFGTVSFADQGDIFTNNSVNSWNIRNFADTDFDLVRDEEAVALSDFGGGADVLTNAGTVRLLTVEDMSEFTLGTDDDTAPMTWDETGQYFVPGSAGLIDSATYGIQASGIEQGHIVNLETFENAGLITMADAETGGNGPVAGDVLVITGGATAGNPAGGKFISNGGALHIDTVLNDGATDITDVLVVDQAELKGGGTATGIMVTNAGGTGTSTDLNDNGVFDTDEGILVVQALESGSEAGAFALSGPVLAGAWQYVLDQTDGQSWYLHSLVSSTGAVYETAPYVLGAFNRLPTLEQRVGQRQWSAPNAAGSNGQPFTGGWVRFTGDKLDATTTTGRGISSKTWGLQTGADFAVEPGEAGQWVLGITGQYGKVSSTVTSALGFGTIDAEGFGVGATATWYGNSGTYVDLQGQVNWIDSDISSSVAGSLAKGQSVKAYALSAEVGHRFAISETATLVPQAQLMWGRIDGGAFTDSQGNAVDLGSDDRTIGRIGLAYEYAPNKAAGGNQTKAYVIGNILHDFSGGSSVKVAGATLSTEAAEKTWAEIGVGGSYAIDENKTLYGEAAYRTSFSGSSDNNGLSGTVGLRIQW
jgi:outer membrane autotransporter protein